MERSLAFCTLGGRLGHLSDAHGGPLRGRATGHAQARSVANSLRVAVGCAGARFQLPRAFWHAESVAKGIFRAVTRLTAERQSEEEECCDKPLGLHRAVATDEERSASAGVLYRSTACYTVAVVGPRGDCRMSAHARAGPGDFLNNLKNQVIYAHSNLV